MSADLERLKALHEMASMVLDARSLKMREAAEARALTIRQLADLEPGPVDEGLAWQAQEQAAFGYEQWAASRRAELMVKLRDQTEACSRARNEVQLAFGRRQVLARLGGKD